MRLIDADALKPSYIDSLCHFYVSIKDINSAPTIDAVEVVRCRDCAFNGAWCDIQEIMWEEKGKPIEFCSYGERGNDEQCQR